MDINSTMTVIETTMASGWFDTVKVFGMWVVEFLFFIFLVQTGIMATVKVYLTAHNSADNLDSSVFGSLMSFSVLFAAFIMFYLV